MSRPVFQATPVRPTRQPSLHSPPRGGASRGNDEYHEPMPGAGAGYQGYADPYGSAPQQSQHQQQYGGDQHGYAHGQDYSQQQYAQPGTAYTQDTWAEQDSYAAHPSETGLRHRARESISYGKPQAPQAPFMSSDPRPSHDESVYSYQKGGWDAGGSAGGHFEASSSTTHLAPGTNSAWDNGYAGGHEAIEMQHQHMPAPGGFYAPGAPPASSGWGYGSQAQNDYNAGAGAGWVGLAAPGTMLAQPQPHMQQQYRDPGAHQQTQERIFRRRTVKRLELTQGNLVIESPIAASLCKPGQAREFTHVRYTAVTCDPDEFVANRYALRPWLMGRKTELMIVLTSYNEGPDLLDRTLTGVIKNIAYLASRTKSKTWGNNAWQKVCVCIVADGRTKMDARYASMLQVMGVYHPSLMVDHVNKAPVEAHLFELTSQTLVRESGAVEVSSVPIQILFCLKEQNRRKLNSHRWFFNAFCAQLDPHVTILLDVGTKPASNAIYHLWKAFSTNDRIGGACGEITVETGRFCSLLVNPAVAAQNFEYKMSNILDKPMESVFGFIAVLPGAFSAYRYKAISGAPLVAYFKGEAIHSGKVQTGSFEANMYLAEDRILCFELVTKKKSAWLLKYVKPAKASTDVPDRLPEFISQRRRWLNGSLFAALYSLAHCGRLLTSGQPFLRKVMLIFQTLFSLVQMVFSLTAIANFFMALYFLFQSATSDPNSDPFGGQGEALLQVVLNVLLGVIVVVIILSLGNRPQGSQIAYHCIAVLLGLIMLVGLYTAGWTIYVAVKAAGLTELSGWTTDNIVQLLELSSFRAIVISLAATYLLWLIASLMALDPWHLATCLIQYLLLQPTFIIVLSLFSFSNLHDISWGTKGDSGAATDLGSATVKAGKDGKAAAVEVKAPSAQDAQELWSSAQAELAVKRPKTKNHRSASVKAADAAATFRTNLLVLYIALNAGLIIIFSSTWWARYVRQNVSRGQAGSTDPYMNAIFYSVAGLSAVRFLGAFFYHLLRLFGR